MTWFSRESKQKEAIPELKGPSAAGLAFYMNAQPFVAAAERRMSQFQEEIKPATAVMEPVMPVLPEPVAPSWEKIKREPADPEYAEFANQCASVLGYRTLAAKTTKPLADLLAKLDIEVLNSDEVNKYMEETQKITQRNSDVEFNKKYAGYGDNHFMAFNKPTFRWGRHPIEESRETMREHWQVTAYRDPIPEFVLHKALQIKQQMPAVMFDVWAMESYKDPFLSVSYGEHPFSEMYFIEVWDEAKFEGRIEKSS